MPVRYCTMTRRNEKVLWHSFQIDIVSIVVIRDRLSARNGWSGSIPLNDPRSAYQAHTRFTTRAIRCLVLRDGILPYSLRPARPVLAMHDSENPFENVLATHQTYVLATSDVGLPFRIAIPRMTGLT